MKFGKRKYVIVIYLGKSYSEISKKINVRIWNIHTPIDNIHRVKCYLVEHLCFSISDSLREAHIFEEFETAQKEINILQTNFPKFFTFNIEDIICGQELETEVYYPKSFNIHYIKELPREGDSFSIIKSNNSEIVFCNSCGVVLKHTSYLKIQKLNYCLLCTKDKISDMVSEKLNRMSLSKLEKLQSTRLARKLIQGEL
jgi:uncharacterized CHY-type Zn-finger protein